MLGRGDGADYPLGADLYPFSAEHKTNVGAAEGCDLLIFGIFECTEKQGQKIAASFHSTAPTQRLHIRGTQAFVGAAEGCDLLIFGVFECTEKQGQKIAASFLSTAPTQRLHIRGTQAFAGAAEGCELLIFGVFSALRSKVKRSQPRFSRQLLRSAGISGGRRPL
jgi:hypothetical protein